MKCYITPKKCYKDTVALPPNVLTWMFYDLLCTAVQDNGCHSAIGMRMMLLRGGITCNVGAAHLIVWVYIRVLPCTPLTTPGVWFQICIMALKFATPSQPSEAEYDCKTIFGHLICRPNYTRVCCNYHAALRPKNAYVHTTLSHNS